MGPEQESDKVLPLNQRDGTKGFNQTQIGCSEYPRPLESHITQPSDFHQSCIDQGEINHASMKRERRLH